MRVAVTGSNGFIGSHLCHRLSHNGDEVVRLAHTSSLAELTALLKAKPVDALVHLAAVFIADHKAAEIEELVDANIRFSCTVLEACRQASLTRVVVIGSSWQHFGADKPEVPVSLYGALKAGVESISRYYADADGLSLAFLKLYDSYGPGDPRPKLIPTLVKLAHSGQPLALSRGEQVVDFTHVQNVVDAILTAVTWTAQAPKRMQDFKVSGEEPMSLRSLVDLICEVSGKKIAVDWGARPYRPREVMQPWSDAPNLPGYHAKIKLREGLRELFV